MDAGCVKEDTGKDIHAEGSEVEKDYPLWDDEEDLRRFLKGGLAAK